jgi:hypothetical protein
LCVDPSFL